MAHDWIIWTIVAFMLIQAAIVLLLFRFNALILGGPLSRISSALAALGSIIVSTGYLTKGLLGSQLPGAISSLIMATGVLVLLVSLLIRVAIPWLRDSYQTLPGLLRQLMEEEIAVGAQKDREIQARREARRQARAARRQA